ncbi:MAG: type II toxin-antitoxin system Phd/YefM family antitoxin [Desulfuromonadales bacterium]|nr:type II toxin-antitoxin system Phd/YefM family antitoxin [Desulfuromonadales bacterium]
MKVMSAREAKNHFGAFLDTARREPVIITKNDRPVGIMISIEDAADTLLPEFLSDKDPEYDRWICEKVAKARDRAESGETRTYEHDEAMLLLRGRLEVRLADKIIQG